MTPIIASVWRVTFLCVACLSSACCIPPLTDDVPPLVESRAKDIVAVIEVTSVRNYHRDECFGYVFENADGTTEVFCTSPPPFKVWAEVVTQLYGPRIRRSISFKTASHWGDRFLTDGHLKLVHLVTDGDVVLMPNEDAANVGSDFRVDLFVPIYQSEIGFLPCGTDALKEKIAFKTPANKFTEIWQEPIFPSPPEVLAEERLYYVTQGEHRHPRFGISIHAISKLLRDTRAEGEDFSCFEE